MGNSTYIWDGTDGYVIKEFKVALYDREMDVLRKYDFNEELSEDLFDEEEYTILTDLRRKGLVYSVKANRKEIFLGTVLYQQLKNTEEDEKR